MATKNKQDEEYVESSRLEFEFDITDEDLAISAGLGMIRGFLVVHKAFYRYGDVVRIVDNYKLAKVIELEWAEPCPQVEE